MIFRVWSETELTTGNMLRNKISGFRNWLSRTIVEDACSKHNVVLFTILYLHNV